jgi:hypothetical protein
MIQSTAGLGLEADRVSGEELEMKASRWFLTIVVFGLLLSSCGGGEKTFTTDDLSTLVLQPSEAPSGTVYMGLASGPADLDTFSEGVPEAKEKFAELGFQGGYAAVFSSFDQSITIGNGALVFKDADGATGAMDVQRSVVIPNATHGSKPLSVSDLGDEAFAFTFDSGPLGKPGAIYFFRVGNAMFLVPGSGAEIKNEDLLAIARKVAARAEG